MKNISERAVSGFDMKKLGRFISLIMVSMMVLTVPCISYALESEPFELPADETVMTVDTQAEADTSDADESEEMSEDTADVEEHPDADEEDPEEIDEESGEEQEDPTPFMDEDTDITEADAEASALAETKTEVTVADSLEELAAESEKADTEAFFTIDASRKKTDEELATEELDNDVADILSGRGSSSKKQDQISDVLEDSGFYQTEEGRGSRINVTSEFAYCRLRLSAGKKKKINAYGAYKAVFYEDYYLLSYESEEATKTAYEALKAEYGEDAVLVDAPLRLNAADTSSASGWGTEFMGMDFQKAKTSAENDVIVAVIDTGVTASHEIFRDTAFVGAYDFVNKKEGSAKDDHGHGTSVAGIIAESTPSNVRIMPLKVLDSKGNGSAANLLMAIEYAEENDADIINLSMGDYVSESSFSYYEKLFSQYSSLIICSSGNDGKDLDRDDCNEFPGELDSTVCVGSIDSEGKRSSFSNYGSALDFAAPGSRLSVARLSGYATQSGTSFAAPYITAAAALKKAEYPDLDNDNITDILCNISEDLGDKGKDRYFGHGCPVFEKSADRISGGDISTAFISGFDPELVYTGDELTQSPVVVLRDTVLSEGTDYTIEYSDNIDAGEAIMTIVGTGDYSGSISRKFKIAKASNGLKVSAVTVKIKRSKLKDDALTIARAKLIKMSGEQGSVEFEKASGSAKLKIAKATGDVTVKKGTGKGSYKIRVKVTASGDENYKAATKYVTVKVKIS